MSAFTHCKLLPVTRDWFRSTILAPYAGVYAQHLLDGGYAAGTVNYYLSCVAHFAHWTALERLAIEGINEDAVACFLDGHLPVCRCAQRCPRTRHVVRAALTHLIELLRSSGLVAQKASSLPASIATELCDFDHYLAEVRGLVAVTRHARLRHTGDFLFDHFGDAPIQVCVLKPAHIMDFMMRYTAGWKPASVNTVSISLRSYLRYKAIFGMQTTALIAALPTAAQWRLARLPKGLSTQEVRRLLDAFDRNTAISRRDYAIARCYIDLGLRTTEITRLQLDDVDWKEGVVQIRSKGQRMDRLPLPTTTGQAIVAYLRKGRRETTSRALFLRYRPPRDRPASPETIRAAVRNAAHRCGLSSRLTGPHILRHTLACRLVQSGASLKAIADLLLHRSLDSTAIYAKVDLDALATVAAHWPGRQA